MPHGYTGPVVVVFGPEGQAPTREGRRWIFEVPPSGVLRVRKDGSIDGWVDLAFAYCGEAGFQQLSRFSNDYEGPGLGVLGFVTSGTPDGRSAVAFFVGDPSSNPQWYKDRNHALDIALE